MLHVITSVNVVKKILLVIICSPVWTFNCSSGANEDPIVINGIHGDIFMPNLISILDLPNDTAGSVHIARTHDLLVQSLQKKPKAMRQEDLH